MSRSLIKNALTRARPHVARSEKGNRGSVAAPPSPANVLTSFKQVLAILLYRLIIFIFSLSRHLYTPTWTTPWAQWAR